MMTKKKKIIVKHTRISVGMISFQFFSEAISCSWLPPQFGAFPEMVWSLPCRGRHLGAPPAWRVFRKGRTRENTLGRRASVARLAVTRFVFELAAARGKKNDFTIGCVQEAFSWQYEKEATKKRRCKSTAFNLAASHFVDRKKRGNFQADIFLGLRTNFSSPSANKHQLMKISKFVCVYYKHFRI